MGVYQSHNDCPVLAQLATIHLLKMGSSASAERLSSGASNIEKRKIGRVCTVQEWIQGSFNKILKLSVPFCPIWQNSGVLVRVSSH